MKISGSGVSSSMLCSKKDSLSAFKGNHAGECSIQEQPLSQAQQLTIGVEKAIGRHPRDLYLIESSQPQHGGRRRARLHHHQRIQKNKKMNGFYHSLTPSSSISGYVMKSLSSSVLSFCTHAFKGRSSQGSKSTLLHTAALLVFLSLFDSFT